MTLLLSVGITAAFGDPPVYHVTDMGPMIEELFPNVQYPGSRARGMNENGDVVGEAKLNGSAIQAWVYTVEHGVVALPLLPGHPSSVALDVSDRDANGEIFIVGGGVPSTYWDLYLGEACLWRYSTVTGEVLETRGLGFLPGTDESIAVAVNNNGRIVGYCEVQGWTSFKYDIATSALEELDFPARPRDINNLDQIVGDRYRGDLNGVYVDLGIPPDCTSSFLEGINDQGWVTGRAGRPWTDGAGRWMASVTRFTDTGWHVLPAITPWDTGFAINAHGDLAAGIGPGWDAYVLFDDVGSLLSIGTLLALEYYNLVFPAYAYAINDNRQLACTSGHAVLLTPLVVMIIPGDVNGDVQVDLDDHCAWVADPIDLNGDGLVDDADEQWLIDRLAVFGFTVEDCNGNGMGDHCDIMDGLSADCDLNDVPDECQPDCNDDGVPDSCEPDCNGNGIPDPCDIDQGTSNDCNGNGVPDECDGGGVTEFMRVYDPPLHIIRNDFIVEEVLVVDAGIVEDVDLVLDIRYRIGDLTMQLSHGNTTVIILDRPGYPEYYGGFVNFGYDAIIDDEGAGPFLEDAGDYCCNFEWLESPPSYRPDDPFSAFDGMPSEGVWSLTISTTETWSPGDGLLGWGLAITRAATPVGVCSDVNGDGVVNVLDLLLLLDAWGACNDCDDCPADLNGDCTVDVLDLLMLLDDWS